MDSYHTSENVLNPAREITVTFIIVLYKIQIAFIMPPG